MTLRQTLTHNLLNIPGWRTNRHIVVIESDDWGSIRMPSRETRNNLKKEGIFDELPYNKYDSLASEEDLTCLFSVLSKYVDKNGNHPVITANCVVANPDFQKIKNSDFKEYHYETIDKTLSQYPAHEKSFDLWKEGNNMGVFRPQFHGREHLNVEFWMKCLQAGNKKALTMFEKGLWGYELSHEGDSRTHFLAGYNYSDKNTLNSINKSIIEGLKIFEKLFGFPSRTFIANCYTWDDEIEKTLAKCGVKALQGSPFQSYPLYTRIKSGKKGKYHFTGQSNSFGQRYLVRNCSFEPSQCPDTALSCMKDINIALRWGKPAIISSHRLNFIGCLEEKNRNENLKMLDELIRMIIKAYPDVEFMSSDQLIEQFQC